MHVTAKADGQWSLSGDQMTITIENVQDVTVGKATLKSDSLEKSLGSDFVTEFCRDFPKQLQEDLPKFMCEQPITATVISISDTKLVLRYEDGEIKEQIRIKP